VDLDVDTPQKFRESGTKFGQKNGLKKSVKNLEVL